MKAMRIIVSAALSILALENRVKRGVAEVSSSKLYRVRIRLARDHRVPAVRVSPAAGGLGLGAWLRRRFFVGSE